MNKTIETSRLRVSIKTKGAELYSVVNKETGLEYMWGGDPTFWGKTSPVLFPIVGALKNDTYLFNNHAFNLARHGFARDFEFEADESVEDRIVLTLNATSLSLEKYPFQFQLKIGYTVEGNFLLVNYGVQNTGPQEMYFSIGGHPAFKVPLVNATAYSDYYLVFNKIENSPRWPISSGGLIGSAPVPFLNNSDRIDLNKNLFNQDALVFKNLQSDMVSLKSTGHDHGLDFHFNGFPFLGIWAAKNADFVCIEPWCGIADAETHDQKLISKEGIEKIAVGESWSRTWKVQFY